MTLSDAMPPDIKQPECVTDLAICLSCRIPLLGKNVCETCGRNYPFDEGILEAINPLFGRNRIAAAFYDGPGWERFRTWEHLFLWFQGGQRGARLPILRHLHGSSRMKILEVGIGDGANIPFLPTDCDLYGVDLARRRLKTCGSRFPHMRGRLVLAEAESLPFATHEFDAAFFIGGFNFVRDHRRVLREMKRVVRPNGVVLVADEIPKLNRFALGNLLGFEALDRWCLRQMGVDREFASMALGALAGSRCHRPGGVALPSPHSDMEPPGLLHG